MTIQSDPVWVIVWKTVTPLPFLGPVGKCWFVAEEEGPPYSDYPMIRPELKGPDEALLFTRKEEAESMLARICQRDTAFGQNARIVRTTEQELDAYGRLCDLAKEEVESA